MKVLAIRNVIASGQALEAGKVYELTAEDADVLLRMGRAVEAPAEEPKPKATRKPKPEASNADQ
jgi:hypothetical protein